MSPDSYEERLLASLRQSAAYPWEVDSKNIVEIHTHISAVFLLDNRVVKVKKARDFGFLNFMEADQRRHFCHREVRFNRRLSSGIYLETRAILCDPDTQHYYIGESVAEGDPPPSHAVDWCVVMTRIEASRFLDYQLQHGDVSSEQIENVANTLIRFYENQTSSEDISRWGRWEAVAGNAEQNYLQTEDASGSVFDRDAWEWSRDQSASLVLGLKSLIEERADAGSVVECHGDLHAQHVLPDPDGSQFVDCIEFNESFRCIDPLSDLAFLYMDLLARGHFDLAKILWQKSLTLAAPGQQKTAIDRLFAWYAAYRAMVRAKVIAFALSDPSLAKEDRNARSKEAQGYFALHQRFLAFGCKPVVFLLSGPAASGKSTLARQLQKNYGFRRLSSDATRKRMFGLTGKTRDPQLMAKMYAPEVSEQVYVSLVTELRLEIHASGGAIIDATNLDPAARAPFVRAAMDAGAHVLPVALQVSDDEIARRLARRARSSTSESDADYEIHLQQKERYQIPENAILIKAEGEAWAQSAHRDIARQFAANG